MNRSGGVVARLAGSLARVLGWRREPVDLAKARQRWGRQHPLGAPLPTVEPPPAWHGDASVDAQVSALERMLAERAARQASGPWHKAPPEGWGVRETSR